MSFSLLGAATVECADWAWKPLGFLISCVKLGLALRLNFVGRAFLKPKRPEMAQM
jgi:hypothetical protein